jgi:tRNA dimethylallyltransferase
VGPTACGKTRLALKLAASLGAEVVSIDSMQVYRGMDVGTAKPSDDERAVVPHHLLDLAEPGESFSVAAFQRAASQALAAIEARGRTAMLVGGSGLYFRAIVDTLAFPPTDAAVRADLEAQELNALWSRLRETDPAAAARIQPQNKRRIVRALEVAEITGKPFSAFRTSWDSYRAGGMRAAGLRVSAPVLRERIERRAREMFAGPILAEAAALSDAGYGDAIAGTAAIGYRDALGVVQGIMTVEEAVERTVADTMRLARRQMRWFLKDPRIRWIDADDIGVAEDELGAYWSGHRAAAAGGA